MSSQQPNAIQVHDAQPLDIAKLPHWQRRYLAALQSGHTIQEAQQRANVVRSTVASWTDPTHPKYDAAFARAEALVGQGVTVVDTQATREDAAAYVSGLVGDAVAESRDRSVPAQARIQNRRFVADVGAVTGPAAAAPGLTIVNTGELTMIGYQLHQAALAPAPAPVIDVTPAPAHIPARVKPADAPTE